MSEEKKVSESTRLTTEIKNLLMSHRLQHQHTEDGDSGYPLVDALSPGDTIKEGEEEIDIITDELAVLFDSLIRSQAEEVEDLNRQKNAVLVQHDMWKKCCEENQAQLEEMRKEIKLIAEKALKVISGGGSREL